MAGLRRLRHALWRPLRRGWETNHDTANTVFLAGCGRSGTTWISELINADRTFRYVFEPFHNKKTPEWRGFDYRQYLPRRSDDPRALGAARAILSGRAHNAWIDSQNPTLFASRRLIKDTRSNLLLGWLRENFPEMPIVLLVRHPLAVVASREKLGWGPVFGADLAERQPLLAKEHLEPFAGLLEVSADDRFALQVINWCIEHYVPLRQLRVDEYHLLHYESLVSRPFEALNALFDYLGLDVGPAHRERLGVPSASASQETRAARDSGRLLRPWAGRFPAARRARAREIVGAFGLGGLVADWD